LLDRLTQREFDASDGKMPYWALLWPSASALAELVASGPGIAGHRVLDLGCGLGLVGLVALARGARATFLDWDAEAVALARESAYGEGLSDAEFLVADWRTPPSLDPFDRVFGADVLYEERNSVPVARFLAAHLAPGGEGWIVDPGRRHATDFPARVREAGLFVVETRRLPPREDAKDLVLWRIVRSAP
jgi:predicted nicotinamide N-methyase